MNHLILLLIPVTLPLVAAFDVANSEAWGYAVIAAFIALVPMMGTLVIIAIQQYSKIREAWELATTNHAILTQQVLPNIEAARFEGETAHAETIRAINGGTNASPDTPAT